MTWQKISEHGRQSGDYRIGRFGSAPDYRYVLHYRDQRLAMSDDHREIYRIAESHNRGDNE